MNIGEFWWYLVSLKMSPRQHSFFFFFFLSPGRGLSFEFDSDLEGSSGTSMVIVYIAVKYVVYYTTTVL